MDDDFYVVGSKSKQGAQDYVTYLDRATHNGGHVGETRKERRNRSTNYAEEVPSSGYAGMFTIEVFLDETNGLPKALHVYDPNNSSWAGAVKQGGCVVRVPTTHIDLSSIQKSRDARTTFEVYYNAVFKQIECVARVYSAKELDDYYFDPSCYVLLGYVETMPTDAETTTGGEKLAQGCKVFQVYKEEQGLINLTTGPRYTVATYKAPFTVCVTWFQKCPRPFWGVGGTQPTAVDVQFVPATYDKLNLIWDGTQLFSSPLFFEQVPPQWKVLSTLTRTGFSVPAIKTYDSALSVPLQAPIVKFKYKVERDDNGFSLVRTCTPVIDGSFEYKINGKYFHADLFDVEIDPTRLTNHFNIFVRHTVRTFGAIKRSITRDEYEKANNNIMNLQQTIKQEEAIIGEERSVIRKLYDNRAALEAKKLELVDANSAKLFPYLELLYNELGESLSIAAEQLRTIYITIMELEQELADLKKERDSIESEQGDKDAIAEYDKQISATEEQLSTYRQLYRTALSNYNTARADMIKTLSERYNTFKEQLESGLEPINGEILKLTEEISSHEVAIQNSRTHIDTATHSLQSIEYSIYNTDAMSDAFAVVMTDQQDKDTPLGQTPTTLDIIIATVSYDMDRYFKCTDYEAHKQEHFRITPYSSTVRLQKL